MATDRERATEAAAFAAARGASGARIGLLTGTGLGASVAGLEITAEVPYERIPHFPASTVQSHAGRLLIGRLGAATVLAFQGRFHLYEGYSAGQVSFPIRLMQELGVDTLLLTNAAGGLRPDFNPGDIMTIADHINLTGDNPLVGANEDRWGPRFPDMAAAYDPGLAEQARQAAAELGLRLRNGVYAGLRGPSLETPAEIRFLQTVGADAVGFSTVQEVIAAVHAGMRVLGLSTITNVHDPERPAPATLEEIIAVAEGAAPRLAALIARVVEQRIAHG